MKKRCYWKLDLILKIDGVVYNGETNSYAGRSASLGQVDSLEPEF